MKIVARGMCTKRGYGCPHCSGADRDRLYALFIRVLKVGGWGHRDVTDHPQPRPHSRRPLDHRPD